MPSPRPRPDAQTRAQALRQDIIDLIYARGLHPGDPMPTEVELVETLGVGRNTVREALKVLQATGVVDVRHGYGMFVAEAGLDAMTAPLEFHARQSLRAAGHEALELVDVRQALEAGLIGAACRSMTEESLRALAEAVDQMDDDAAAGRDLGPADHRFHSALFAPLDNRLLSSLLEAFWSAYTRIQEDLGPSDESPCATAAAHRVIYEAVAAGSSQEASALMERHFDGIRRRIQAHVA